MSTCNFKSIRRKESGVFYLIATFLLLAALRGVLAMGDRVGFEETGHRLIPPIGLNREVFLRSRTTCVGGASLRA